MNRNVMMMWIRSYLQIANDQELEYLMYLIRGYLRIGKQDSDVDNALEKK